MSLNAYASPGRRYKVHRPIGRGGFGTVYLADMLGDDGFVRAVALKVLNSNVNDTAEVARRFRDEARVLGLLRHRAIVHVDGLVYLGERQALVMEYIDGADLGRIMKLGPIAPGPAVEIVGEVANALDVAVHTSGPDGRPLGLLHRDVKPSNVRITPAGEVKVLDFGLATVDDEDRMHLTTPGAMLGTVAYMAPEQMEGARQVDHRADIYSLGAVLIESVGGIGAVPQAWRNLLSSFVNPVASSRPSASEANERLPDLTLKYYATLPGQPSRGPYEVKQLVESFAGSVDVLGVATSRSTSEELAAFEAE